MAALRSHAAREERWLVIRRHPTQFSVKGNSEPGSRRIRSAGNGFRGFKVDSPVHFLFPQLLLRRLCISPWLGLDVAFPPCLWPLSHSLDLDGSAMISHQNNTSHGPGGKNHGQVGLSSARRSGFDDSGNPRRLATPMGRRTGGVCSRQGTECMTEC